MSVHVHHMHAHLLASDHLRHTTKSEEVFLDQSRLVTKRAPTYDEFELVDRHSCSLPQHTEQIFKPELRSNITHQLTDHVS